VPHPKFLKFLSRSLFVFLLVCLSKLSCPSLSATLSFLNPVRPAIATIPTVAPIPLSPVNRSSDTAQPPVSVQYRYYPIKGATLRELQSQISQLGPLSETEGERFAANTDWYVHWSYRYNNQNNRCSVQSIDSRVDIVFTLPQWDIPATAPQSLVDTWNQYMTAINLHEEGHKENGVEAGTQILQKLKQLPSYSSCKRLQTVVNGEIQKIITYHNQQDISYDQTTQHGLTQGAVFPSAQLH
jgi:predicted secreted Zn-dependent protease